MLGWGGWGEVTYYKKYTCLAGSLAPTTHYYRATQRQRTDASLEHKKYDHNDVVFSLEDSPLSSNHGVGVRETTHLATLMS